MRNLQRQAQDLYFSIKTFQTDGIDEVSVYTKPEKHKFSVSASATTVEQYAAGIVPDYERYITSFDRTFEPIEGMQVWVDVTPELDSKEDLVLDSDGNPTVMPDYTLRRKVDTKMGNVARYLIKKNGDEVGGVPVTVTPVAPTTTPTTDDTEGGDDNADND